MRIIFLSTPEFGILPLKALLESKKHEVIAVISQPDRPQDRGKKLRYTPLKEFALQNNLTVYQFEKISRDGVEIIKNLNPDIMVTASYGQILSQQLIDIPKYGIINIHGSLLPKYRGASPVQAAILNGDTETGITIMKTEAGLDTGDILLVRKTKIFENETCGELMTRLSEIGARALIDVLDMIEDGTIEPHKQSHLEASVTTVISKEQGKIFWNKSSEQIKNQIHAYNPSPVAFSYLNNEKIKFYNARVFNFDDSFEIEIDLNEFENGVVIKPTSPKNGLFIKCGFGILEILKLQFPSSKVISGHEAVGGRKIKIGDKFTDSIDAETNVVILSPKD